MDKARGYEPRDSGSIPGGASIPPGAWVVTHFPVGLPIVSYYYQELEHALMDYESFASNYVLLRKESEVEWDPAWTPEKREEEEEEFWL